MATYDVEIRGCEPGMLMNRFDCSFVDKTGVKSKQRVDRGSPQEQAERVAYRSADGGLYISSEQIFQACVKASTQFKMEGRGKKTYKDAVKGSLCISPDEIPLGRKDFEIDGRGVVVQRARVVRYRPKMRDWKARFTVRTLDENNMPGHILEQILIEAGDVCGIGDYRPRFGRFTVARFKEVGAAAT